MNQKILITNQLLSNSIKTNVMTKQLGTKTTHESNRIEPKSKKNYKFSRYVSIHKK